MGPGGLPERGRKSDSLGRTGALGLIEQNLGEETAAQRGTNPSYRQPVSTAALRAQCPGKFGKQCRAASEFPGQNGEESAAYILPLSIHQGLRAAPQTSALRHF